MSTSSKFFKIWVRFMCEDLAESVFIFLLLMILMAMNLHAVAAAVIATFLATIAVAWIEAKAIS